MSHLTRFAPSLTSILPRELRPIQGSDEGPDEESEQDDLVKLSQEAENALREVERAPDDADAIYRLAVIKFRIGEISVARSMVEKFIQSHSDSGRALSKGDTGTPSCATDAVVKHTSGCVSQPPQSKIEVEPSSRMAVKCEAEAACDGTATAHVDSSCAGHNSIPAAVCLNEVCSSEQKQPLNGSEEPLIPSSGNNNVKGSDSATGSRVALGAKKSSSRNNVCSLGALSGVVLDKHVHAQRRSLDLREGWPIPKYINLEKLLGHLCFEQEDFEMALRRYWRYTDGRIPCEVYVV